MIPLFADQGILTGEIRLIGKKNKNPYIVWRSPGMLGLKIAATYVRKFFLELS